MTQTKEEAMAKLYRQGMTKSEYIKLYAEHFGLELVDIKCTHATTPADFASTPTVIFEDITNG